MEYLQSDVARALKSADFDAEAAQKKMVPRPRGIRSPELAGRPREGGVLVILYLLNEAVHLVLTRRRDDLNSHAGQISFPGGRRENGESLITTAVREAQEELSVDPSNLNHLGRLACLYIPPSDYEVHPFVAWHAGRPVFIPQVDEVAEILEIPLAHLLDPANCREEVWAIRGFQVEVPFFLVGGHKVWGATAMMLSEFIDRLRTLNE
jgi:8-oxo-dGTP pyrophosphatase MutT (NUDIX family)